MATAKQTVKLLQAERAYFRLHKALSEYVQLEHQPPIVTLESARWALAGAQTFMEELFSFEASTTGTSARNRGYLLQASELLQNLPSWFDSTKVTQKED